MAVVLVNVIFFVLLDLGITISTSDTCYSFHNNTKAWAESNKHCEGNNGSLVSLETEKEYQCINSTIQRLDLGKKPNKNEWYIGLKDESKKGKWEWNSGYSKGITKKWVEGEPSSENEYCGKMIKDYQGHGLFGNVNCKHLYMFICEYHKVTSELEKKIKTENGIFVCNHTCYDNNNDESKEHSSVRSTSDMGKMTITATRIGTTNKKVEPTTSISHASTISSTTTTAKNRQLFPIMLVVIVLAVLLAICICSFVAVFCWFRKKSGKGLKETKSSRNPSKRNSASRSVAQDQSDLRNANSGGVQIVNEDKVHYLVPADDIDYPRPTTNTRDTDLSTYAEVHDAIKPSAKLTSKYYDDEDLYLNPVNSPPTSDAQFYASVDLDSKPLQDVESKYEKEHPELKKAVTGASCNSMDATNEPSSSLYYATTDLSKPNEAIFEASKQGEEHRCKDVTTEPISCNSLYATTDLCSKAYDDNLDRTQHPNEAARVPSFYNNLYESTEIIHLRNKGIEQDGKVSKKEEKPHNCETEASNGAKRKSRHPSIGSIMSASRKSKDMSSIATTSYKQATGDAMKYAMLDFNNDEQVRPVYAQVNKIHKK